MFADIVFPKNNEEDFIKVAAKLGIKKLWFAYDSGEDQQKIKKKLDEINNNSLSIRAATILSAKKPINIKDSNLILAKSSDNDRNFIESKMVNLIYAFEEISRKDYLSQRASGINHILCDLARRNNVAFGFSYGTLLSEKYPPYILMGRMIQNISLCNKYKVKQVIASFSGNPFALRAPNDLVSLFAAFGMDIKAAKEALSF